MICGIVSFIRKKTQCFILPWLFKDHSDISHHIMSHHVTPCHAKQCHVMSCHVTTHQDISHHIMANTISIKLFVLRWVQHYLTLDTSRMHSMTSSLVDYCDVLFSNMNVSVLVRIQKGQISDTRIILGLDRHSHVSDMLSELKWLTSNKDRTSILLF